MVQRQPKLLIGSGQGGYIAALMSKPYVVEAACRSRVLTEHEMRCIRRAWANLVGIIVVNPCVLPQRSEIQEVLDAVPEIGLMQPHNLLRAVFVTPNYVKFRKFAGDLAIAVNTVAVSDAEMNGRLAGYVDLLRISFHGTEAA